ncbi:hypothetical protein N7493_006515 [Penicillium malachiteum]|uniref:GH16 domain-containing protein n=1 Tax=Penicillium malachiteum TaxID=1324776 RepID=A0AAD6MVL3_9EURO|nr:hypothetical protein N7493_006515 [Penicillium malachiteum]
MPFRQALQGFIDKAEKSWDELNNRSPQPAQSYNRPPPPPIPTSTKPSSGYQEQPPQIYWQPNLHPQAPVSANFYHEQGQHGWGNNESQNYIDSPQNSFHSAQGDAVIVRALINHGHPDHAQKFTSARLSSHQTLSRPRGYPFKWPEDGEVDIMEAWNGDAVNHTCLHWGHFNGQDWNKHRVLETPIPNISSPVGVKYDFIWDEDESTGRGRLVWLIDGVPIMRAEKPPGTRKMSEFRILINIAVGGNVCQGNLPSDGCYETVVRELAMWDAPPGGWREFDRAWMNARDGKTM